MRNLAKPQHGVCATCSTFCTGYTKCYRCAQLLAYADAVLPISFSVHMGQLNSVLGQYKRAGDARARTLLQRDLAAVLWRFLAQHEACLAKTCSVEHFDVVATVPSGSAERDAAHPLPVVVGQRCEPTKHRYERLLERSSKQVPPRTVDVDKYDVKADVRGLNVLLIDDTWTTGASVQSAAGALKAAGATAVGVVVIGRHVHDDFQDHGERLRQLPRRFDWDDCVFH